jgi:hypothetical protein
VDGEARRLVVGLADLASTKPVAWLALEGTHALEVAGMPTVVE